MTDKKKVFGIAEVLDANAVKYDEVEAYGGVVRIGSLSSADMLQWIADSRDPIKKSRAGLRLLVKSIVDGEGNRLDTVTDDKVNLLIERFAQKDNQDNGKIIDRALVLNGLPTLAQAFAAAREREDKGTAVPDAPGAAAAKNA